MTRRNDDVTRPSRGLGDSFVVYSADEVNVGDVIAYPALPTQQDRRTERDWLRVSRVNDAGLYGFRVHPQDWERDVEFVVITRQVNDKGVEIRVANSQARPE